MTDNNLGKDLIKTIGGEYLDPVKQVLEAGVDSLMKDGAEIDLPLIGFLYSSYKAGITVRDRLFFNKISNFLEGLGDINQGEREEFVTILREKNQENKFGEAIILLIENANEMGKPKIIGKIMQCHILGEFDYEKALRLCHIVDKSYLEDLRYLPSFNSETKLDENIIADNLHRSGLLTLTTLDLGTFDNGNKGGNTYLENEYGNLLEKIVSESGAVDSMYDSI